MTESKSYKIQLLRGLAIVAVVFIHNTPDGWAQIYVKPFLNIGVAMFLFLSGMLSDARKWNPKKRLLKIIIPYIIYTALFTAIFNINDIKHIPQIFAKQLFLGKSTGMYFVFVYCELTLLIPLIDKLAKSKYKMLGFVIAPLEIVVMRLIPTIMGRSLNEPIYTIVQLSCLGWFTYYYLGYLLGNNLLRVDYSKYKLLILYFVLLVIQMLESYWYYKMGSQNYGTQLKLSALLTGSIFMILAYKFIMSSRCPKVTLLKVLGDYSFGIFFLHTAVMAGLNCIPNYSFYIVFPLNAVLAITASAVIVFVGRKIFGKYSKYLAL